MGVISLPKNSRSTARRLGTLGSSRHASHGGACKKIKNDGTWPRYVAVRGSDLNMSWLVMDRPRFCSGGRGRCGWRWRGSCPAHGSASRTSQPSSWPPAPWQPTICRSAPAHTKTSLPSSLPCCMDLEIQMETCACTSFMATSHRNPFLCPSKLHACHKYLTNITKGSPAGVVNDCRMTLPDALVQAQPLGEVARQITGENELWLAKALTSASLQVPTATLFPQHPT